ncbi:hypothetical protein TNCV_4914051 [Trichonephila clavipes]|nr:hypothetical protein TNCV_4914051 [Trichonephila clavipes]
MQDYSWQISTFKYTNEDELLRLIRDLTLSQNLKSTGVMLRERGGTFMCKVTTEYTFVSECFFQELLHFGHNMRRHTVLHEYHLVKNIMSLQARYHLSRSISRYRFPLTEHVFQPNLAQHSSKKNGPTIIPGILLDSDLYIFR